MDSYTYEQTLDDAEFGNMELCKQAMRNYLVELNEEIMTGKAKWYGKLSALITGLILAIVIIAKVA